MTWPGFVAAYRSFDPDEFIALFLMGSNLVAAVLSLLVVYIKHGAPKPISDMFYPIASKTAFALLFLLIGSWIYCLLAKPIVDLFLVEHNAARICALGGAIVCCLIALLMAIIYKDAHWIVLNRTTFSQQKVTIKEEDGPIRFANPASGVTQRLCLASGSSRVEQLREPGTVVAPGQVLHVPFHVGDYEVISVENPGVILHIHVSFHVDEWNEPGF